MQRIKVIRIGIVPLVMVRFIGGQGKLQWQQDILVDNLIALVDNNKIQLDGWLKEVMSPYPIGEKFRAFGWNVLEIDGHDVAQIHHAIKFASETQGKPTAIICSTIKGKRCISI
ncbi:MAG: hypothetical protein ACLU6Y_20295 [Ruminococcus sp.]